MDELIAPSNQNLEMLASRARIPSYDRSKLSAGIVHIGLGNFHRAHQAWYLHRLFDSGEDQDWAIVGAGVRPADAQQRVKLLAQDCLTTLIELNPASKSTEIIGSMIDYVAVEDSNSSLIARMAKSDIRIVSLTVTEGGYYIDPASGGFDANHPDIVHDVANQDRPRTAFGAMIAALRIRRDQGIGPFTGLSCDNLQGNGHILRRTIVSLAYLMDPELAAWINDHCSFPNSMVDCIAPATGPDEIALVRNFGIDDEVPVTHENFRQWVIEDDFCAGRPAWDKVGATFSDQVGEFEAMKLRVLNGGHQIIALPGELLGLETISASMAHPLIRKFLRRVVSREIAPHVASVPGMTPLEYLLLVDQRFANTEIKDTTRRVAFDGSSRHPGFLVPSIRDGIRSGTPVIGLALISALWCRYCLGSREDGSTIEPNDPNWTELTQVAVHAHNQPSQWLEMRKYYGDIVDDEQFVATFARCLGLLAAHGVEATLQAYLAEES
ncbi:MAG: mannitol dehydrogenase family protein [Rhizobiaceae bacterium]